MIKQKNIVLKSYPRGFHLITDEVCHKLDDLPETGLLNLYIKHTSAALTINENTDPAVRNDLDTFIDELVPDTYPYFTHTMEGIDDMSAHIKSSLFGSSITIPISNHTVQLGTWQGIYLCEFRNQGGNRKLIATIYY